MTLDVIALCRARPDLEGEIGALLAAGPDLLIRPGHRSPVLELVDETERRVLAIDGPRLVQIPGEVARLLDVSDVAEPVWWIEMRARSSGDGGPDPKQVARRLAEHLVDRYGGLVWPVAEP